MNFALPCAILLILGITISHEADTHEESLPGVLFDYIYKTVKDFPTEIFTDPENNQNSLKYALYTPNNPKEACFVEPTPGEFDKCSFNPSYKTQILIHGFVEILKPGNQFDELRDALLNNDKYNVIIMNWTLYNNFPLTKAIDNIPKVGKKAAELLNFVAGHTGAHPKDFHCIGHSLGAHVCGHAARRVPKFGRVTGLDPGGITLARIVNNDILLTYTDADYVDVVHDSFIFTGLGLGLIQPIGDMDFYMNGGIIQKPCKFGREYKMFKGVVLKLNTIVDLNFCDHFVSIQYFINSVRDGCVFRATACGSFLRAILNPVINLCPSNSSVTAEMGFRSKKIPGLPPKSVFYVDTLEYPPYCKNQK